MKELLILLSLSSGLFLIDYIFDRIEKRVGIEKRDSFYRILN